MFTIRQNGDEWELLDSNGRMLSSHATYDLALGELSALLEAQLAAADGGGEGDGATTTDNGLLPEPWRSDLCFSEDTGDGRDFTDCIWTARDPNVSTLPLMLQTETEFGHFGATLAGYFTSIDTSGSPTGEGRFYDSEAGRQLRDMLLDGRRFGVSVDPGAVMAEFECIEYDDDGWCDEGIVRFAEYEIIGVTATPFPAFAAAMIELATSSVAASAGAADDPQVAQAAAALTSVDEVRRSSVATRERVLIPTRPPLSWFSNPALLMPTPLTITEQGHVLGHVAAWGTCHVGSERVCVTPPESRLAYRHFLTGEVLCDDSSRQGTGALTWGIPHADLSASLIQAQAHYADSRHGWADVNIGEDEHGIWIAGACRPQLEDADLRVLRALALSGDWRYARETRDLELVAALAVNVPGFPIPRAVTASGMSIDQPRTRAGLGSGQQQMSLVASGIVLPDALTGLTRSPAARSGCGCGSSGNEGLARMERMLERIDRRTRHLTGPAIEHVAGRLAAVSSVGESGTEAVVLPPGSFVLPS